jgi:hypothetical protein
MDTIEALQKRYLNREYETFVITFVSTYYLLDVMTVCLLWTYKPDINIDEVDMRVLEDKEKLHMEIMKYYDIIVCSGQDNSENRNEVACRNPT